MLLRKSKGKENTFTVLYIFVEKNPHRSGPVQFKPCWSRVNCILLVTLYTFVVLFPPPFPFPALCPPRPSSTQMVSCESELRLPE